MQSDIINEDDETGFIIPIQRSLLVDVTPIPQSDFFDPSGQPCSIKYSSRFDEVMSLFRALRVKQEKSRRMLGIAGEAVLLNAANYTAWSERRSSLTYLLSQTKNHSKKEDLLLRELAFTDRVFADLLCYKNYQVWQHRKVISQFLGIATQELEASLCALHRDAKNYHAWSHRQWALLFIFTNIRKDTLMESSISSISSSSSSSLSSTSSTSSVIEKSILNDEQVDIKLMMIHKQILSKHLENEFAFTNELLRMREIEEEDMSIKNPTVEILEIDKDVQINTVEDEEEDDDDDDEDDEDVSGAIDLFNNSAWNHRYFCIFHLGVAFDIYSSSTLVTVLQKEATFAVKALQQAPENESALSYLRGIITICEAREEEEKIFSDLKKDIKSMSIEFDL